MYDSYEAPNVMTEQDITELIASGACLYSRGLVMTRAICPCAVCAEARRQNDSYKTPVSVFVTCGDITPHNHHVYEIDGEYFRCAGIPSRTGD